MTRVYEATEEQIKTAIESINLFAEYGYSTSLRMLKNGHKMLYGVIAKDKSRIVGWGVVWSGQKEIHLFVHPEYRKNGVGSRIVRRTKRNYKNHKFCPWDEMTKSFFYKRKCNVTNIYL